MRSRIPIFLIALKLLIAFCLHSNTYASTKKFSLSTKNCRAVQSLDSLKKINLFPEIGTSLAPPYPTFPDLVYEVKIALIDDMSPIPFDYNEHVRSYIDIYTLERREQVSQMLGLAELYFPLFDEMLDKHRLPLELKYLAVVESALNPIAVSISGAAGLWQFKINSGRMFDLKVNSYIDERMDPIKSTEAACLYLKYLYRIFNDWHLTLAAYNVGPGVVRNAIFRSGGNTNFWELYDYLPESAQKFVPAITAAAYVMQNASDHKIAPTPPLSTYLSTDTIQVSKPLSLIVLSDEVNIPLDLLRFLNPIYRRGFVPKTNEPSYIRIPSAKVEDFFKLEEIIYEKTPIKSNFHDKLANAGNTNNRIKVVHTIQSGEYLHKIAVKYSCTVDDILVWNPDADGDLAIDQTLTIWVDNDTYQYLQRLQDGLSH